MYQFRATFPANPTKDHKSRNDIDEVEVLSDDSTNITLLSTETDSPMIKEYADSHQVKCTTAENSFLTFVLHGTRTYDSLVNILRSKRLNKSAFGVYGPGVYVRVNTAAKWSISMKDLSYEVAIYGPYFLVFSVAVLDRYEYTLNGASNDKILTENDTRTYIDQYFPNAPVRSNNISIKSDVSVAYLQKIWINYHRQWSNPTLGNIPPSSLTLEEIKSKFNADPQLAEFVKYVEPMPEVIDPKYFVRFCKDWQTPLHQIDGAVVNIVNTESTDSPIEISECYLFREYIQLAM